MPPHKVFWISEHFTPTAAFTSRLRCLYTHMAKPKLKNHLAANRTRLGLSLRQVAELCGKPASRICALERAQLVPTVRDCVACEVLYKRSLSELWPKLHSELQTEINGRIRSVIRKLDVVRVRSHRKRGRIKAVCRTLSVIIGELSED